MRSPKFQTGLPARQLTAFEMQRRPAAFQRQALQAPLTITSNGLPTIVAMSVAEYLRLQRAPRPDGINQGAYPPVMDRNEAIERIRAHRNDLVDLGAFHVALYGSVARDQGDGESDVDVVVDTDDGMALGLFALARLSEQLEHILGRPVDVISRRGLEHTTTLKHRVAADLVHVF